VFLGHSVTQHKMMADETAKAIDEEIRSFVSRNYERSKRILTENMDKLHTMAQALIKYETIDSSQIADIMAGNEPRPPKDWGQDSGPSSGQSAPAAPSAGKSSGDVDGGKIAGPAEQH